MNGPTDQLIDSTYRGQEAITTAARLWTDAAQNYAGSLYSGQFPLLNVHAAVNASFELATQLLTLQRDLVNTWLDAGTMTREAIAHVGEVVAKASTEAGEAVNKANVEASEAVVQASESVAEQVRGDASHAPSTSGPSTENTRRPRAERTRAV